MSMKRCMEGKNCAVLRLSGEATCENEASIHEASFAALHTGKRLVLDLEGLTDVDISFMVCLCSLHRTAELAGKRLSIRGADPGAFTRVFEFAGHCREKSCMYHPGKKCAVWQLLWKSIAKGAEAGQANLH